MATCTYQTNGVAVFAIALLLSLDVSRALASAQAVALKSENVTISPPDIYPLNGTFDGEVEVRIVANQPHANIYWTKNGETPTNASRLYTGPISLFEPGMWTIQAIAIPNTPGDLLDSIVISRTYRILKSEIPIPSVSPPKGRYRGIVKVTLSGPSDILNNPAAKIQYVVDVDDPGNTWQTFTGPFILDTPGEHIVKSRIVVGTTKEDTKASPIAKYRFEIKAPLVYDVTTECVKCQGSPTVGQIFTVWMQSAEVNSNMFLTTSSRGCELNRHMLDDTEITRIKFRQVAYRFVTYTEPQPKVYVCLQEPSHPNQTYVMVPRRIKSAAQGVSEAFFTIEPAFGAIKKQLTEAPYTGPTRAPFTEGTNFSAAFIVVFAVLILAIFATCATMGKLMKSKGHQMSRIPKATVAQDDA